MPYSSDCTRTSRSAGLPACAFLLRAATATLYVAAARDAIRELRRKSSTGPFTYGGWGIYPDEGSTGILIPNNIASSRSAKTAS